MQGHGYGAVDGTHNLTPTSADTHTHTHTHTNTHTYTPSSWPRVLLTTLGLGFSAWALYAASIRANPSPEAQATALSRPSHEDRKPSQPNFVYLLADDLAWNSVGFNGFDLGFATPNIDKLARNGIIFDNFYGEHLCTPARAALMTGRYPIHTGMQDGLIDPAAEYGLPIEERLFPQYLQSNGYATHMIGKWHLGHYSPGFLPTARGFDTYLGYLCGEESYFTHKYSHTISNKYYNDFIWSNSTYYTDAAYYAGRYSLEVYFNEVASIIHNHDERKPLFIYASTQNVHGPLSNLSESYFTTEQLEGIAGVSGTARQMYAKALIMLDNFVGDVIKTLEVKGILDNTYIIFSSDNGGCSYTGGRNGPLRGMKATMYEGGVKVPAFVWSPLLPSSTVGLRFQGLTHITDWYPTILSLAGIDPFSPNEINPKPLDGYDMSGLILGKEDYNHGRHELVHNLDVNVDGEDLVLWANASGALRVNNIKVVFDYYEGWYPIEESASTDDNHWGVAVDCSDNTTGFNEYVFDITLDPYEHSSIQEQLGEDLYAYLLSRLCYYVSTTVESVKISATTASTSSATSEWKVHDYTITPFNFTYCGIFEVSGCKS